MNSEFHTVTFKDIKYKIFIHGTEVSVVPAHPILQDTIEEMVNDIGVFSIDYLRELFSDNLTMYPRTLIL